MQGARGDAALAGSLLLRIINVGYLPLVEQVSTPHRTVDRQLQLQGQQGTPGRVRRVRVRPGGQGAGGPLHSSLRRAARTGSSVLSCQPGTKAPWMSWRCWLLAHSCSRAATQPDGLSTDAMQHLCPAESAAGHLADRVGHPPELPSPGTPSSRGQGDSTANGVTLRSPQTPTSRQLLQTAERKLGRAERLRQLQMGQASPGAHPLGDRLSPQLQQVCASAEHVGTCWSGSSCVDPAGAARDLAAWAQAVRSCSPACCQGPHQSRVPIVRNAFLGAVTPVHGCSKL